MRSLLTGLRVSSIVSQAEITGIYDMDPVKSGSEPASAVSEQPQLLRALGLWDTTAIVMGS